MWGTQQNTKTLGIDVYHIKYCAEIWYNLSLLKDLKKHTKKSSKTQTAIPKAKQKNETNTKNLNKTKQTSTKTNIVNTDSLAAKKPWT